jgi:hypothetical protein
LPAAQEPEEARESPRKRCNTRLVNVPRHIHYKDWHAHNKRRKGRTGDAAQRKKTNDEVQEYQAACPAWLEAADNGISKKDEHTTYDFAKAIKTV